MAITKDDVLYTAKLSRLKLSEREIDTFTKQLGDIVSYVEKLNELKLDEIEPTAHILPVDNVSRADKVTSPSPDNIIFENAPDVEDRLFMVPKIIE